MLRAPVRHAEVDWGEADWRVAAWQPDKRGVRTTSPCATAPGTEQSPRLNTEPTGRHITDYATSPRSSEPRSRYPSALFVVTTSRSIAGMDFLFTRFLSFWQKVAS